MSLYMAKQMKCSSSNHIKEKILVFLAPVSICIFFSIKHLNTGQVLPYLLIVKPFTSCSNTVQDSFWVKMASIVSTMWRLHCSWLTKSHYHEYLCFLVMLSSEAGVTESQQRRKDHSVPNSYPKDEGELSAHMTRQEVMI